MRDIDEWRYNDDDLERKMINWQRWKIGGDSGSPLGWVLSRCFDTEIRGGYREASVPILAGEARDVDDAVNSLEQKLKMAIYESYLRPDKTDSQRAQATGISRRTFCRYVYQAKRHISFFLRERRRVNRERFKEMAR